MFRVLCLFAALSVFLSLSASSMCDSQCSSTPLTMLAVAVPTPCSPAELTAATVAVLVPQAGELLVRVAYSAVNRADTLQHKGGYPAPAGASYGSILGLEAAGIVEAVGSDVLGWAVGDRVAALLPGGGYAEFVTVAAGCCLKVPASLPLSVAGGIPEVWATAYQLVVLLGKVQKGEFVLVHAAASGMPSLPCAFVNACPPHHHHVDD